MYLQELTRALILIICVKSPDKRQELGREQPFWVPVLPGQNAPGFLVELGCGVESKTSPLEKTILMLVDPTFLDSPNGELQPEGCVWR